MIKPKTKKLELDMDFMETIIAYNSMFDTSYLTSIIDIANPIFFKDNDINIVFKVVSDFYRLRGVTPTATEVKAHLASEEQHNAFKRVLASFKTIDKNGNKDELLANTEQFFRERAVYEAIQTTIKDYSDEKKEVKATDTLDLFTKACNISLVDNLGMDYFQDIQKHIDHLKKVDQHISTGYSWLDRVLGGGFLTEGRALYVVAAVTNGGKSILLGNFASNIVKQNKTAIVISLEMSEDMYAKRLSSQMSKIPIRCLRDDADALNDFANDHMAEKPQGKLFIKEFPPKSVTVNHLRAYIEKLIAKKGIKPDVIIVDYVNLLQPTVVTGSSYTDVKATTEQLRALSYLFACPIVTASQLNRDAFKKDNPGLESTSESMGLSMTADVQIALWSDESDKELGIIHMSMQKNRFGLNSGKEAYKIDYDTLIIENMTEDFASSSNVKEAEGSIGNLLAGLK